jgi:hypothetical protein
LALALQETISGELLTDINGQRIVYSPYSEISRDFGSSKSKMVSQSNSQIDIASSTVRQRINTMSILTSRST